MQMQPKFNLCSMSK